MIKLRYAIIIVVVERHRLCSTELKGQGMFEGERLQALGEHILSVQSPLYRRVLRAGGSRKFRIRFYGMEVSKFNLKYATGSHLSQITIPLNPANVCERAWSKYLVRWWELGLELKLVLINRRA